MRILFLGAPIAPKSTPGITDQQRFDATGKNTGNLLIGQSLFEELDFAEYGYGTCIPPGEANLRFDVIVVGAANFIFRGFDLGPMAEFIEKTMLPCVMVGLGVQAPAVGSAVTDIPEGTHRLLQIVADRSKSIGVRGHFTAEILNDFGIRTARAVGCPSLFRRLNRNLTIRRPPSDRPMRISLNGSRNVIVHAASTEAARWVEAQLLRLSVQNGYSYVLQNEMPEMQVLWADDDATEYLSELEAIVTKFDLGVTSERFLRHIKSTNRLFFDLNEWDEYISAFDLSIGSRFHGNAIALTNGVPAIMLTHDSRTTEMAQLMRIPHIMVEEVGTLDVKELALSADYDHFEQEYPSAYDRFVEFLDENGLPHKLERRLSAVK